MTYLFGSGMSYTVRRYNFGFVKGERWVFGVRTQSPTLVAGVNVVRMRWYGRRYFLRNFPIEFANYSVNVEKKSAVDEFGLIRLDYWGLDRVFRGGFKRAKA